MASASFELLPPMRMPKVDANELSALLPDEPEANSGASVTWHV